MIDMKIAFGAAADAGVKRTWMEDAWFVDEKWLACGVADGAGGCSGGRVASEEGLHQIVSTLEEAAASGQLQYAGSNVLGRLLARGLERANVHIMERVKSDPALTGMGTTMTAAIFGGGNAFIAHVGDSRAYLWRAGELTQLTDDHTLINEMVRAGKMTPAEAEVSHFKTIITRVIGFQRDVDVDSVRLRVVEGDRVLLATDGLWRVVPDVEIGEILAAHSDPLVAARSLISRAIALGAPDNIAAVLADMSSV